MLITLDGKGYALIRTHVLINTGIKQQIKIAIQEKQLNAFELSNNDHLAMTCLLQCMAIHNYTRTLIATCLPVYTSYVWLRM